MECNNSHDCSGSPKCSSFDDIDDSSGVMLELGPHEPLHYWRRLGEWEDIKRSKHTLVAYRDSLYVFGGECEQQTMNDLLRYDLRTNHWRKECTQGQAPARRYNHSAVLYDHRMFVFGGYTGDVNKNDLFEYRFPQLSTYNSVSTSCSSTSVSLSSAALTLCDQQQSHEHGGASSTTGGSPTPMGGGSGSMLGRWSEWRCERNSARPVPRTAHGAAVYDSRLWIVAGYDGNSRLADMWSMRLDGPSFSGGTHVWESVEQKGSIPPPRCNFPITVARNSMFIFSGESGNKYHHKLFQFDFSTKEWTCLDRDNVLQLLPAAPEKRFGHTMVAFGRHLYLYGGTTGAAALPTGLHQYDLDARQWAVLRLASDSQPPGGRLYHSAAVAGGVMFVFGGYKSSQRTLSSELFRIRLTSYPRCTLQEDFARFFDSRHLADLIFVVGKHGERIAAHTAFVAARSAFLRAKICAVRREHLNVTKVVSRDPATSTSQWPPHVLEVMLPDAEPRPFELVLSYIYTDQLRPSDTSDAMHSRATVLLMMQVYQLAEHYQMARLQHVVSQYLETWIREENVLAALQQASRLRLEPLREYCLAVLIREPVYRSVVNSGEFEQLEKVLIVEIVRRKVASGGSVGCSPTPCLLAATTTSGGVATGGLGAEVARRELLESTNSLQRDMQLFLEDGVGLHFADCWLLVAGHEVAAHSAILAARSGYFEALFRSLPPANGHVQLSIGDLRPSRSASDALMKYLYYGEIVMSPADSLYLLNAPNFFALSNLRLQVYCKHNIERNIDHSNVVEILEAAHHIQSSEIRAHALSVITRDFAKVMREPEIRQLSQPLLLSVMDALADQMSSTR